MQLDENILTMDTDIIMLLPDECWTNITVITFVNECEDLLLFLNVCPARKIKAYITQSNIIVKAYNQWYKINIDHTIFSLE